MQSATLTRPEPGTSLLARLRAVRVSTWERAGLALLVLGAAVGFVVYPTYPNYDSAYSLVWGRELLDGTLPTFDAFRAPTEHPLAVAFGAVLSPLGTDLAPRALLACTVASFVVLVVAVYQLGKHAFGLAVGAVAAVLLLTRLDYAFLAARGYVDVPYLALVVLAAVAEVRRRERTRGVDGTAPVWVALILAGLLRPEAWLLAALYWVVLFRPSTWPQRARFAAAAALAGAIWAATDWIVTGDPFFSQNHTNELAAELGRQRSASEAPALLGRFLEKWVKWPVMIAAVAGLGLAWRYGRARLAIPAVLALSGIATFLAIAFAGLAVIDRYLAVSALGLLLFAAYTIAGFTTLRPGHPARRPWAIAAAACVLLGVGFTATHLDLSRIDQQLRERETIRANLEAVLTDPTVRRARSCGPVTVPTHKLLPDVRWILDQDTKGVLARNEMADFGRATKGVHLHLVGDAMLRNPAYGPFDHFKKNEPGLILVPGPDAVPIARRPGFVAYAAC